jgi:hypothetical protein
MPMIQLLSKKRGYCASEYARNIALANFRKIFAGEQTPRVRHQGRFPTGTLWFGTTPPSPRFPFLGRFPACATYEVEVTLDYATGETYGQGKSDTAILGIRTPPLLAFAKSSLRPRSIRVLRHWPCDPGGMTVCGLSFRVTVDETADYATQV